MVYERPPRYFPRLDFSTLRKSVAPVTGRDINTRNVMCSSLFKLLLPVKPGKQCLRLQEILDEEHDLGFDR